LLAKRRAKLQLAALLKKFQFETSKSERIAVALEKFRAAEDSCRLYNHGGYKELGSAETEWVCNVFTYARSFLQKLLGDVLPSNDVLTDRSRHGPGATLDTKEGLTSTYHKYSEWPYSCTEAALGYARLSILDDPRWIGALEDSYRQKTGLNPWQVINWKEFWSSVLEVVPGNRITFVPKDARTERSIAIEPTMNLYLQLGVDGFMRRRLKRWGVDLDHQGRNQVLAKQGSEIGGYDSFCTIDLSAASDTISRKVCELLLPPVWYDYLLQIRSPEGELDGETISYEKISSMGNGFTFALETSIFTALIYGVMREVYGSFDRSSFAVYGDDLIIRKSLVEHVVEALNLAGFTINAEKSFFVGPVRESCGTDWIQGEPVRPVFFAEIPSDVSGLFVDVNRLQRHLSLRWDVEDSLTVRNMKKWIPQRLNRLEGPRSDTEFDSYIHARMPQRAAYRASVWKYRRLILRPRALKGREFLFRKLMHNLRPNPPRPLWSKQTGSGSRFTITRRNAMIASYKNSVSDYWRSTYTESVSTLHRFSEKLLA
jgi:plastocyanin